MVHMGGIANHAFQAPAFRPTNTTKMFHNFTAMASFPDTSVHLCVFLLIALASGGPAYGANILLTGQTLGPEETLSYGGWGVKLVMQYDCNLVLKQGNGNSIWYSGSTCLGCNRCNLSFTDNGQLVIRDRNGRQRWISPNDRSKGGKYVAVLRPEGQLAIYGPGIWSVGPDKERISNNNNEMMSSTGILRIVYNALFSSEVLYDNDKLSNNGYNFILKECELALKESSGEIAWSTWTRRYGNNCFATLDRKGELFIRNGTNAIIWSNEVSGKLGEYVLVVQQNGNVVIYGPKVWSTGNLASEFLQMAAAKK